MSSKNKQYKPYKRANAGEAFRDLSKGRICSNCQEYKDRNCFYEHPSGYNGLGPRCKDCWQKQPISPRKKELYQERKNKKLCVKCGEKALETNVFCENCWFIDRATYRLGNVCRVKDLKKLWNEQKGKCFYTDKILIPGINASIDHQIPTSRGGTDHIENLRWVTKEVNMIKSSLTHKELIEFCNEIIKKFGDTSNE